MKNKEQDFDELQNQNTCLQNSSYYKIIKWNQEKTCDIKKLAYKLYEERMQNNEEGNDLVDWYKAKSIILLCEYIK